MKAMLALLVALPVLAQEECPPEQNGLTSKVQDEKIKILSKSEKEGKAVSLNSYPTKVTSTSVEYNTENLKLKPGECAYFMVPDDLQDKAVLFVNLGHMQSVEDDKGWNEDKTYDNSPGLTTVLLNEANSKNENKWRYWNGMASGKHGAKFAEGGGKMELEGLYEWYKNGHSDVATETMSHDPLNTDAMKLCSVGKDTVTIGSLALKVFPGKANTYIEKNFGEGNVMGDSLTAKGRAYGSKEGAIQLGYGGKASGNLPEGWSMQGGSLSIPLEAGKSVKSFEASVSDQREDGKSGWARLNAYIQRADGSRVSIIERENVPPEGVLLGAPEQKYVAQPGDRIVVGAQSDKAYLMGLKIGLD